MKPSLIKLQKVFKLEAERGYDNHAVVGGLERMFELWEAEARLDEVPEDLIQAVGSWFRDYGHLSEKSRAEALQGLWKRIQRSEMGEPVELPEENTHPSAKILIADQPPQNEPAVSEMLERVPEHIEVGPAKTAAEPIQSARTPVRNEPVVPTYTAPSVRRETPTVEPAALLSPVTVLQGVGPRIAQNLSRLGLNTLRDMLFYFPRRYNDFSSLKPINRLVYGEEVTVIGMIKSVHVRQVRSGKASMVEVLLTDGSGTLRVSWFNQPWIAKRLHEGMQISVAGKVDQYLGRLVMTNPEMEPIEEQQLNTNRIVPVYPLTAEVNQHWLRKQMNQVITYWAPKVMDPLPEELRASAGVMELPEALLQIHFPDNGEALKAARDRLSFDEILLLQLGVLRQKRSWHAREAVVIQTDRTWLEGQIRRAPFKLTGSQKKAIEDIITDLESGHPMNCLIQGDVGSGKTLVAAIAIAIVGMHGGQASFMAPTSLLADQHYHSLVRMLAEEAPSVPPEVILAEVDEVEIAAETNQLESAGASEAMAVTVISKDVAEDDAGEETGEGLILEAAIEDGEVGQTEDLSEVEPIMENEALLPEETSETAETNQIEEPVMPAEPPGPPPLRPEEIRLLIGSTSEAEKNEIRGGLADGSIRLVIGTHALIEDPVAFKNLELVIVDEQHRFGVEQRGALRSKGDNPHLLVMTATPIPRSLALTVYGDLDLTVMDEMPPGRQPVSTHVLTPRERERAYTLIRSKIQEGQQVFIIYPLIEESENSDSRAAVAEYERLKTTIFPKSQVGLLHGRMRPDEKEAVMAAFRSGEYQILVSTTVIEVGVDIPNATVMLIEGANRFGLAQLHQLRGRVGRGAEKSYCLLIPDKADDLENERLQVMTSTNDGFVLAERDLEQRGPGQFLGTRQAGYDELKLASLMDVRLIEKARRFASTLFETDPDLSQPRHRLLASSLQQFWDGNTSDIS